MTSHSDFISCVCLYCDGAFCDGTGSSAVGVVVFDQDHNRLDLVGRLIDARSSNEAEYKAIMLGLDQAARHTRLRVECYSDSEIVIGQMLGRYRLRSDNLRRFFHRTKDLERPFEEVVYCRVRRKDQRLAIAHKIAHDTLNGRTPSRVVSSSVQA